MNIKLLTEHHLEFLSLKGGCSLLLSKYHIVRNHMLRLIYLRLNCMSEGLLKVFPEQVEKFTTECHLQTSDTSTA